MQKIFMAIGLSIAALTLGACGNPLMVKTSPLETPHLDRVLVTFIRSSVMAPTTKSGLWDRERFIGEIKAHTFIQYETTPGKHLFLAESETWSYVEANLQGGRHYLVKTEVVPGGGAPRIHLQPVVPGGRTTKEDIEKWFDKLKGFKPSDAEAEAYRQEHVGELKKALAVYDEGRVVCETLSPRDAW